MRFVAPIPDDPEYPIDFVQSAIDNPYRLYHVMVSYAGDMGICQMAVATKDDKAKCVITKMVGATMEKIVTVYAERIGVQVQMPTAKPTDSNLVLKSYTPELYNPLLFPDGKTRLYRGGIKLVYAMQVPLDC